MIAAALMIALGYPGEVISDPEGWTTRVIWGSLSSIPFFYILYVLWVELTASLSSQPPAARKLIESREVSFADHVGGLSDRLRIWRNTEAALDAKAGG